MRPLDPTPRHLVKFHEKKNGNTSIFSLTSFSKDSTFLFTLFLSDGLSLRLSPGSARARHLEGLLKLGICKLNPSIGMSQASAISIIFVQIIFLASVFDRIIFCYQVIRCGSLVQIHSDFLKGFMNIEFRFLYFPT